MVLQSEFPILQDKMQVRSTFIHIYYNDLNTDELEKQSKGLFASSKWYIK